MKEWQPDYEAWQADPTSDRLFDVVSTLQPTIQNQLARSGMHQDPLMRSKANVLTAQAVKTWKPNQGASLPTWVGHQLTQLHRFRRLSGQVLQVPERIQLDAWSVERARREFMDAKGREPDLDELSDASKMSRRRLRDISLGMRITPSSSALPEGVGANTQMTDHIAEAMDAIYDDADTIDRAIMEKRMGHGGSQIAPTLDILRTTKLTAPQLARRTSGLARRIQELTASLESTYS